MIQEGTHIKIGGEVKVELVELVPNQMVTIHKCGHYDVAVGTVARFVKQMEGGIAVDVDGRWKDAKGKWTESTQTVFVSHGDYTPV